MSSSALSHPVSHLSYVVRGCREQIQTRSSSHASSMFISATINDYVIFPPLAREGSGAACDADDVIEGIRLQCNVTSATPRRRVASHAAARTRGRP